MAGTRTVYRGSRGRFAGSSGGKAEKVKVGAGYSRTASVKTGSKVSTHPKGLTTRSKGARIRYAAARGAKYGAKKGAKTALVAGVGIGVSIGVSRGLTRVQTRGVSSLRAKAGKPQPLKGGAAASTPRHVQQPINSPNRAFGRNIPNTARANPGVRNSPNAARPMPAGPIGRSFAMPAGKGAAGKKLPTPNYNSAVGKKEFVGRRLKPGEGRGFKLAVS